MENYFGEIFVTLCPRLPLRIPALADRLVAFFSLATKAQRNTKNKSSAKIFLASALRPKTNQHSDLFKIQIFDCVFANCLLPTPSMEPLFNCFLVQKGG